MNIDERLTQGAHWIVSWPLSEIYLKDNELFPWLVLIPRVDQNITEIHQLNAVQQQKLMQEIARLSEIMSAYFEADKINVGALGNIVRQLHIHVISRKQNDLLWPHSLWQADVSHKPYSVERREMIIKDLQGLI